jgi:hypothetical protein
MNFDPTNLKGTHKYSDWWSTSIPPVFLPFLFSSPPSPPISNSYSNLTTTIQLIITPSPEWADNFHPSTPTTNIGTPAVDPDPNLLFDLLKPNTAFNRNIDQEWCIQDTTIDVEVQMSGMAWTDSANLWFGIVGFGV